ncbi:MAG: hypothetical protein LC749_12460 [Actinobacteria bacterium]|nr:hypothetical protein [Actinomycetota bacterium]
MVALEVQIVIDCANPPRLAEFWAPPCCVNWTSRPGGCLVMADPEGNEFCLH